MNSVRNLLSYILENIVDHPEDILITDESEEGITRFNVTLNDADYPRVIGRQGYTIKALTDILRLYDVKQNESSSSKIYINITAGQKE